MESSYPELILILQLRWWAARRGAGWNRGALWDYKRMRETSINSLIPSADIELLLWPGIYWKRTLWGVVMSFRYWNETKLYPHISACLCVHVCLLFFLQVVHQRWFGHLHIIFFLIRDFWWSMGWRLKKGIHAGSFPVGLLALFPYCLWVMFGKNTRFRVRRPCFNRCPLRVWLCDSGCRWTLWALFPTDRFPCVPAHIRVSLSTMWAAPK